MVCGIDVTGVIRGIVAVDVCVGGMVLVSGMTVSIDWIVGNRESEGVVVVGYCCVVCVESIINVLCVGSAHVTIVLMLSVCVWGV